jgi:RNA polymerase sporulation-specific sigma factor
VEEIAKALELPPEDVTAALDAIQEPVSLYDPVYNDGGDPIYIMDQICDTKNTDFHWLENLAIKQALTKLTPREQMIIDLRFFQGKTQMEVADEISISQAQVSRLEKGALQTMRKYV